MKNNSKSRKPDPSASTQAFLKQKADELLCKKAQLDPDNWTWIPEFGVMPADVNFEGFRDPLVHMESPSFSVAFDLQMILRTARMRIRMEFPTHLAVRSAAWNVGHPDGGAWTHKNTLAAAYMRLENALGLAATAKHPYLPPKTPHDYDTWRIENIARAGALLAAMMSGDFKSLEKLAAVDKGASRGGARGAVTKRQDAIDPEAVVQAAIKKGWPDNPGVAVDLAPRFGCTATHIRRILREWIETD